MARIEKILSKARATLADTTKDRWTDARLLSLLEDGQRNIALHHKLLKKTALIGPVNGQILYNLPSDLLRLVRVTYDSERLPLMSYEQMDKRLEQADFNETRSYYSGYSDSYNYNSYQDVTWESDTGPEPTIIIYNYS